VICAALGVTEAKARLAGSPPSGMSVAAPAPGGARLGRLLPRPATKEEPLEHIGSTSVPGLSAITDRHDSTNEDGAISRRVEALGRQVQQHLHVIKRIESTDGIAHFDDPVGDVSVDSGEQC